MIDPVDTAVKTFNMRFNDMSRLVDTAVKTFNMRFNDMSRLVDTAVKTLNRAGGRKQQGHEHGTAENRDR